jgi:3-oxoadipate enol-lactonase
VRLVLLHALPLDERMWEGQREAVAEFDVVAPRLYGRGNVLDAWARSLLDEVDGELVAVGASMGGYAALAMARRAPDRVHALLLAGSRAGADSPERRRQRAATSTELRSRGLAEPRAEWGERLGPRTVEEMVAAVEALRDRPDATDVVRSFDGPLLAVVGDRDELVSVDEARELAAAAPHGAVEVVDGAGHFVSLDAPERFNAIVRRFLAPWT